MRGDVATNGIDKYVLTLFIVKFVIYMEVISTLTLRHADA